MLNTSPFEEPEERFSLREMVSQVLSKYLPSNEALEVDRAGSFRRDLWSALGEAGVLGLGADEEHGGSGGTVGDALAVIEEIARVLPSLAVDVVLCGMAMRMLAEDEAGPISKHLEAIASGEKIFAYGLSEPGVGTDLFNLRTTARLENGNWVLNGQKTWISLGVEADYIFVLARTEPIQDGKKARGLSLIAVPADQKGVVTQRVHLAGMRAAITSEVFLDDAVAPAENIVGVEGRAVSILSKTLDVERVLAAGISLGISRAALDLHIDYVKEREAFGAPIGKFQAIQHPVADSLCDLAASRALINSTVRTIESGQKALELSAMSNLVSGEASVKITDRAMRAMGAMGLAEESPMQMYFRDSRLQLFSPISNEMIKNILAEAVGLPRSY